MNDAGSRGADADVVEDDKPGPPSEGARANMQLGDLAADCVQTVTGAHEIGGRAARKISVHLP